MIKHLTSLLEVCLLHAIQSMNSIADALAKQGLERIVSWVALVILWFGVGHFALTPLFLWSWLCFYVAFILSFHKI